MHGLCQQSFCSLETESDERWEIEDLDCKDVRKNPQKVEEDRMNCGEYQTGTEQSTEASSENKDTVNTPVTTV